MSGEQYQKCDMLGHRVVFLWWENENFREMFYNIAQWGLATKEGVGLMRERYRKRKTRHPYFPSTLDS